MTVKTYEIKVWCSTMWTYHVEAHSQDDAELIIFGHDTDKPAEIVMEDEEPIENDIMEVSIL